MSQRGGFFLGTALSKSCSANQGFSSSQPASQKEGGFFDSGVGASAHLTHPADTSTEVDALAEFWVGSFCFSDADATAFFLGN